MSNIKPTLVMGNTKATRFQRLCYLIRQLPKNNSVLIHYPDNPTRIAFENYMEEHKVVFECATVLFSPMVTTDVLPKAVALHPKVVDPGLIHVFLGLNTKMSMVQHILAGEFDVHEAIILDVAFEVATVNAMYGEYAILINN